MTIIVKKFDKTLFCDSYINYIRNLLLIHDHHYLPADKRETAAF